MIGQFLAWYLAVQLLTLVTLPLALRYFVQLPDRGYALARPLGILLFGLLFWLGYSYGLVRNEAGGAWLAVFGLAALSAAAGWRQLRSGRAALRQLPDWRYILAVELLFLGAFALWAVVRAYDPAANHTEKPMDLMFMHSIAASATYPPMDAWLAGFPISYYYFGYWLLTALGLLAGQTPAVAYNLGQACWYGLLLSACFGVGYNLLRVAQRSGFVGVLGGLLTAIMVGMAANLQGILEWLYAIGVDVTGLANFLQTPNFPAEARVTNQWYVDFGWWWWRSSRVIEDLDLAGNHIEVIDEFPVFSYILGDNHPHVLAMPFAVLAVGIALNLLLAVRRRQPVGEVGVVLDAPTSTTAIQSDESADTQVSPTASWWQALRDIMPLGWAGWLLTTAALGALIFLNTWDFPPYWLLTVMALAVALRYAPRVGVSRLGWGRVALATAAGGALLAVGALVIYLPYFLTAQSQAGGFTPNLFYPTRLRQFVVMFGVALLTLFALALLAWRRGRPTWQEALGSLGLTYGLPLSFLVLSLLLALNTGLGSELLARTPLPAGATEHLPFILARWTQQGFTFLLLGALLGVVVALVWARLARPRLWLESGEGVAFFFALLLAGVGLLLVYAPEFVYLRDNFGTRMNTVFKFYYQAWLLFGVAGAFAVMLAITRWRGWAMLPALASSLALVLVFGSTVYLVAGAFSKANGFASSQPTFDAAAYLDTLSPGEWQAVEWVRANTLPTDRVLEAKGASYRAEFNRLSTMTGRPTLLGWDGHESQWRGKEYGAMAADRPEALEGIYRDASVAELAQLLQEWAIDYVVVGPAERQVYGLTPSHEARLAAAMTLVFEAGDVRIYRAR